MVEAIKAKRPLTERQAKNCEEAREPACHCRCGGAYHGGKRGGGDAPMGFYYGLSEDDPHYTPSPERRKQLQQEKLAEKRRQRDEARATAEKVASDALTAYYTARREENWELAEELHKKFLEAHTHRDLVYKQTSL